MKKFFLAAILFTGFTGQSFAQTENTEPTKKEKWSDQYIGVQLNGLIRQVFNFNNSTSSTSVNPYLLTYHINLKKSGWGLRVGIGYNYMSNTTDDGITNTISKTNDLQARLGIEKAFALSGKWTAGVGIDGIYNTNNDNTNTTIHSFDTVNTVVKSTGASYGGGAMAWLRYSFTPRILVGTEASFYYVTTALDNSTITTEDEQFGGGPVTTETKSKPKNSQGVFNSPVVFYLIVKF